MAFFITDFHPGAGLHLLQVAPGELEIVRKGLYTVIHVTFGNIGVPLGDQRFDDGDNPADMVGGLRL